MALDAASPGEKICHDMKWKNYMGEYVKTILRLENADVNHVMASFLVYIYIILYL